VLTSYYSRRISNIHIEKVEKKLIIDNVYINQVYICTSMPINNRLFNALESTEAHFVCQKSWTSTLRNHYDATREKPISSGTCTCLYLYLFPYAFYGCSSVLFNDVSWLQCYGLRQRRIL